MLLYVVVLRAATMSVGGTNAAGIRAIVGACIYAAAAMCTVT